MSTVRKFLVAAGAIGMFAALISASSELLVTQCEDAGNTSCYDIGGAGMQFLLVGVFAVTAWARAYYLFRN